MRTVIKRISKKVNPVLQRYGVERAGVFGSFSRAQEKTTSDLDLLISLNENVSLLRMISLKHELEDVLGRKVDLVEYAAIKPTLKDAILKEEIPIL